MSKDQHFSAVDRYRCIMQPDRPHFSSGAAIVISILMMIASVVLCVPKFVTATVSCFESKYVDLDVLNMFNGHIHKNSKNSNILNIYRFDH